jgi:hypothetical protein
MSIFSLRRSPGRAALPLGLALFVSLVGSLRAAERGLPQITVYPAEVHKAGPQSFDIAQDRRGVLYFGNLQGVVSYDGAWWRLLKLPDDQAALSVATDANDRIALGLVSDFGYLIRDSAGAQQYHSLLPLLPEGKRAFGDVNAICAFDGGFLYVAEKSLLRRDGKSARVAAEFQPDVAPRGCLADEAGIAAAHAERLAALRPRDRDRIAPAGLTANASRSRAAAPNGQVARRGAR